MNLLTNKQLTQISKQISLLRDGVRILVPMAEYLARNPQFASNTVVATAIVKELTIASINNFLPAIMTKAKSIQPLSIESINITSSGCFPNLNKNDDIADYLNQEMPAPTDVLITDRVELSPNDYDRFTSSLLDDRDWLTGKGGNFSTTRPDIDTAMNSGNYNFSESDMVEYRQGICLLVVEVLATGRPALYIDPQGYGYARYVGFPSIAPDDVKFQQVGENLAQVVVKGSPVPWHVEKDAYSFYTILWQDDSMLVGFGKSWFSDKDKFDIKAKLLDCFTKAVKFRKRGESRIPYLV